MSDQITDGDRQELLMLYESSGRDIWHVKLQQWRVTNYGLLVHAALVGYATLRFEAGMNVMASPHEALAIVFLATLASVVGIWFLAGSQIGLAKFRSRAEKIRQRLGNAFEACYNFERTAGNNRDATLRRSPWKDCPLILGMSVALGSGATLVSWYVYRSVIELVIVVFILALVMGGGAIRIGFWEFKRKRSS